MDHWGNQKIPRNKWQWKHDGPMPMWCSKSSSKREVYSNKIFLQKTRNISNKQPNFTVKQLEKKEQKKTNPKISSRKEIIKIRPKRNEKQMKETIAKINKTKAGSVRR